MALNEARLSSFLLDNKGLSPKNVEKIIRAVGTIRRTWGINEPTEDSAVILKSEMRKKGLSANTIRIYMWALKYWAQAYGGDIDFRKVSLPKLEKKEPKIIPRDVMRQIIEDEKLSLRDRAMVMLFAITAGRLGEIGSLRLDDINHKEKTILLRDTKTRKEKIAPLLPAYYPILMAYLEERAKYLDENGGKAIIY